MNEDLPLIMESVSAGPGGLLMEYGLPKSEVLRVCKDMYKKDITKLTLQISDPVAMQLNKNMKATFMDQVGTVGELCSNEGTLSSIKLSSQFHIVWNIKEIFKKNIPVI